MFYLKQMQFIFSAFFKIFVSVFLGNFALFWNAFVTVFEDRVFNCILCCNIALRGMLCCIITCNINLLCVGNFIFV